MSSALGGIIVLDVTASLWASLGTAFLGDFGAQVIKIEPPNAATERDHLFELANRNKMSLALDLDGQRGRHALTDLLGRADVFVTDLPFVEIEERGLDFETVRAANPELIYGAASGFGPQGPDSDLPALDELAAARTGMMPILPQPGQPPVYAGAGQMYSSVMLAFGVAAALAHRKRTGEGQRVDVSLLGGNMYGASLDIQAYLAIGGERFLRPLSRMDAGNPMSGPSYPTQDGRWVTLTMPDTGRYWPAFADAVGLDSVDPRFDSHDKRCESGRLELIAVLDEAFRKHPAAHWRQVFIERGLSGDVIEDFSYPANDPVASDNGYIIDGKARGLGFPIFMSETPARLHRTAPGPGEHTVELLRDVLGYNDDQIADLSAAGAASRR